MRKALSLLSSFAVAAILFVTASVIAAWTAPTMAPPNGNVPAPINVGTIDQIKAAGIGVNTLAVFGNAVISTVSGYLNFNTTVGVNGYGFRDNAGTMEFKNLSGQWRTFTGALNGAIGPVSSIAFSDGTTQTTAAATLPSCISDGATLRWSGTMHSWQCSEPLPPPTTFTWSGTQSKFTGGNASWYSWTGNSYSMNSAFGAGFSVAFWNPTDAHSSTFDLSFVFSSYNGGGTPSEPTVGLLTASQMASYSSGNNPANSSSVFGLYMYDVVAVYENGNNVANPSIPTGSTIHIKRNSSNHFEVYNGSTLVYTSTITNSQPLYVAFGGSFNSAAYGSRSIGISNISMTASY